MIKLVLDFQLFLSIWRAEYKRICLGHRLLQLFKSVYMF